MASFKELCDLLGTCFYGKRRKSYDSFQSQNSDFDYDSYLAFDLKEISTADGFAKPRSKRKDAQRPIP